MTKTLDITADVIDVRDVIERVEELREEMQGEIPDGTTWEGTDEKEELQTLETLLTGLCGKGGVEPWEGGWYPVRLIKNSYFRDYAEELARDCGMVKDSTGWPNNCIDWEKAAGELQWDYSSVDIDGVTYWYR